MGKVYISGDWKLEVERRCLYFIEKDEAKNIGNSTLEPRVLALLVHLLVDSILVLEGSRVSKGDLLARIGNSGNSSAPHLHFHVAEVIDPQSPSTLNAIGQPFSFESFNVESRANLLGTRFDEMPTDGSLLSFPNTVFISQ